MALDPVGVSAAIPLYPVPGNSLETEPQDQVRQVASQIETGAQINPLTAQTQVQGVLQSDQQQQNADAQRQERAARDGRGERIDIEA